MPSEREGKLPLSPSPSRFREWQFSAKFPILANVSSCHLPSLNRDDIHGAAELLSRTLPDVSRLPQHALRFLAKNALRQACKAVPVDERLSPSSGFTPTKESVQMAEGQSVPAAPILATNSNDLLPSVRPRVPHLPSSRKRRKTARAVEEESLAQSFVVPRPAERLEHVGGISDILGSIRELIQWPLRYAKLYQHLGVSPPRGILLHGPPGCGKSLLAHAVAGEFDVSFLRVSGPEIVSGVSGESERTLRALFDEAVKCAPSIVFVDEVDAIAAKRDGASKEMERRIVSQLLLCMDNLASREAVMKGAMEEEEPEEQSRAAGDAEGELLRGDGIGVENGKEMSVQRINAVIVIAATSRPESLEPALRRAGRLDREIELGAPDETARGAILVKLCRESTLAEDFDVMRLAKRTAGYVGADLHLLVKEAGLACIRRFARRIESAAERDVEMQEATEGRVKEEGGWGENGDRATEQGVTLSHNEVECDIDGCAIGMEDFDAALNTIQPSALREGFAMRPNVSWANIGSLETVRSELMMSIVTPIRHPELFSSLGLRAPAGVLLYGPPGCGKTLLARAVAGESGANFISVKGPELLSKYVGDSELAVRRLFARARSSAPCVIFFDELDALAPRRAGEGSGASERVVNMLLTEMDGFAERRGVFVVAATNRPDIIDPAMLRPGRLDKLIFVPLPDGDGRVSILNKLLKGVRVGVDVDVEEVGRKCEGFSGADLQAVIRGAGEEALKEGLENGKVEGVFIERRHFEKAVENVGPSVSERDARMYREMEELMRKGRGRIKTKREEGGEGG